MGQLQQVNHAPPWTDADPEADLRLEPNEKLDDVIGAYQAECDRSREIAAQRSLDYAVTTPRGRELTWMYLHVILETGVRVVLAGNRADMAG